MKVVYINDIIKTIVQRVSVKLLAQLQQVDPLITGVHFEYGHYTDINERLRSYATNSKRTDRYPLIALFEDDRVGHQGNGFYGLANKKIIILYPTTKTFTREQREERTFKPVLYPIYEEFLNQIRLSGEFSVYSVAGIEHDMILRPHWGDPALYKPVSAGSSYLLTDILDGIELSNLQLQTYQLTCDQIATTS